MTFKWENILIRVLHNGKYRNLVNGLSGSLVEGEICAIMGPTGGGKTTLMNALYGIAPSNSHTQGSVMYNNSKRRFKEWNRMVGYVKQSDMLNEKLTPKETLTFYYRFYRSNEVNPQRNDGGTIDWANAVESVMEILNLKKIQNSPIKNLSGGERKRICIGITLLKNASILFLDEPTSGLDTLTAYRIVKVLKDLAVNEKKIIILTIHQPSCELFEMFDYCTIIAEGNMMFNGKVKDVEQYFLDKGIRCRPKISLPEMVLELCSPEFREENQELFSGENAIAPSENVVIDRKRMKKSNDVVLNFIPSPTHIYIHLKRYFVILFRDKGSLLLLIFVKILIFFVFMMVNHIYVKMNQDMADKIAGTVRIPLVNTDYKGFLPFYPEVLLGVGSSFILFQVSNTVYSYFSLLQYYKAEIATGLYSITTFYMSTTIYTLLLELPIALISLAIFYLVYRTYCHKILSVFLLTPLLTIPYAQFLASLASNQGLATVLSTLSMVNAVPVQIFTLIVTKCKTSDNQILQRCAHLSYLIVLCLPVVYMASMSHLIMSQYSENQQLLDICLTFLGGEAVKPETLQYIVGLGTLIAVIFGIYLSGRRTKPDIRMELERKSK